MKSINQLFSQKTINGSKKTILILALLLTVVTNFSFANGFNGIKDIKKDINGINGIKGANITNGAWDAGDITGLVNSSFKHDFKNAELISSEVRSEFTKLTFRMNGVVLFAYYTGNGKLLAIVRNIISSQLPLNLMMDLKKNYSKYWITNLFEIYGNGENEYYISLENADTKLVLRADSDNAWEVYQKAEKE